MLLINLILFFIEKNWKPANAVEIKATKTAWSKTINIKLDKRETSISLTPPECPFRLYYDDLKSLLPRSMILGQVLDSLLIAISSQLFKDGKKVYILQESFFPRVHTDIYLEKSIPGSSEDIEYIVALSFYNRHWSLILVHVAEKMTYYLDPLFGYVPDYKVQQDLIILNKIIWHHILNNDLDSDVPIEIPGWKIMTSSSFSKLLKQTLPKQRNRYDCGLFAVMYFFYIVSESVIDFHPGYMDMIRKWALSILLNFDKNKDFKNYVEWLVKKMSSNRLGGLKLIVSNFCKLILEVFSDC